MIGRLRNPPSQKALPLASWPKVDREIWHVAQAPGGVLDDHGIISHLRTRTRKDLTQRYAYFLSFLAHRGRLEHYPSAAASVTRGPSPAIGAMTSWRSRSCFGSGGS